MNERITIADFVRDAAASLDENAHGYYRAGADRELTLADNEAAFDRIRILPRVLRGVGRRDLSTTVLGIPVSMPVIAAPMAMQRMASADGELDTARACRNADTVMVLSTVSNTGVEQVVPERQGPIWFQLYVYRDRSLTENTIRRAEAAGCRALVLTVDAPLIGQREADVRGRFHMPDHLELPHIVEPNPPTSRPTDNPESALNAYASDKLDPDLDWDIIDWIRERTSLPIVLKGILHPDDAVIAADRGVDAIVVSNHGGRQLDTVPSGIDALPAVVGAVAGRVEVLMDGGVRRGTDVLKALAFGARAVLVGRPLLWGLTLDGAAGAEQVLEILRTELDRAMALAGCPDLASIDRSIIM